ncbi:MAG TPA: pyruvate, phosphate dikinase [Candidatus Limnocylindrales bacterium]|nr:pyruvate, phosphate dikinase [Candidatus Limnocylindrales bacterium]
MRHVYPLDHEHGLPAEDVLQLVGGKAANLGVMARELGLPVPPGFVITTATCREFLAGGWPDGLDDEIRGAMAVVERRLGRRFGDPADPLLVSVRSGAPVSMPGMMDTILNVGATAATEPGLAAFAGPAFGADCRRRLATMFRDVVGGGEPPDDPWEQLRLATEAVFRSWNSERARAYRSREAVPEDLGTAVTVQAMVFGNRDSESATGVAFTRNPATGERELYGDVLFGAQGEDVVAGTHRTDPISALDDRLPAVAAELRADADRLERHYADLCDIEFTIETATLWLLQVRVGKRSPEAALRIAVEMAEEPAFPLDRAGAVRRVAALLADPPRRTTQGAGGDAPLAQGLPASPGVGSGRIATDPSTAVALADAGEPVVLVREETSPDDVHGMARANAILTSRGGIASHAAVVARGWGIPAVVGAEAVRVLGDGIMVDGRSIGTSELLTVDGGTGEVFLGAVERESVVVPEAATLLRWAGELGIAIGETQGTAAAADHPGNVDARAAAADGSSSGADAGGADAGGGGAARPEAGAIAAVDLPDACLLALAVKGMAGAEALGWAVGTTKERAEEAAAALVTQGLAATVAGAFRLTEAGQQAHQRRIDAERAAIGAEAAAALLDGLVGLDPEIKRTVTAWQLRDDTGGQVLNDHADAAYDASVLERLAALAADADAWLAARSTALPRLATYRSRLRQAADLAIAGDGRYVASPRVDSYHGIWFELHEELIQLAGRTREEEAAAGRA